MSRVPRVPLPIADAGEHALDRKTAHYLGEVLRLGPGDAFVAFDPEQRLEADATMVAAGRAARYALGAPRPAPLPGNAGVVLIQAAGKADKVEQVIRHATALGVGEVHVIESERSVSRSGERAEARRERWQACALDAARQSGRGDYPKLGGPSSLEAELAALAPRAGLKLCLAPSAQESLKAVAAGWRAGQPLCLLIGPEGGLSERELACCVSAGFRLARFGELVLRTEIAGIFVLGALSVLGEP
jgi:16S rRNA (uracil1498-N3)-methyltransferase